LTIMGLVLISFLNARNYAYYMEFYSIINILFVLTSGAVWPEYLVPPGFMTVVKSIWPYIYIANPLKFLNVKGIGWDLLWPYIIDALGFCLVWLTIAVCLHVFIIHHMQKTFLLRKT